MSVSVNLVGMTPGGGGSFPMAGTRPKVRKSLTVASGSMTWVAPANVYFANVMGCGGGGSGALAGDDIDGAAAASGGGGAEALLPSTIQVNPGSAYVITVGAGGASKSGSVGSGNAGTDTTFIGDIIYLSINSGRGGIYSITTAIGGAGGEGLPAYSSLGFSKIAGGRGGAATGSGTPSANSGSSVDYTLGGAPRAGTARAALGGGGASLYGTGSLASVSSTGSCGFGAGSGGAESIDAGGFGVSAPGGSGFFRIVWEE